MTAFSDEPEALELYTEIGRFVVEWSRLIWQLRPPGAIVAGHLGGFGLLRILQFVLLDCVLFANRATIAHEPNCTSGRARGD